MKKYIFIILVLLTGCYSIDDDLYIESEPVPLEIESGTIYRADINYYVDPPFSIKVTGHNFYYEEDINSFYDNVEIAKEEAISNDHFDNSNYVILYIHPVDKRGYHIAPIYRWRGPTGKINTQRGYVYKEILK